MRTVLAITALTCLAALAFGSDDSVTDGATPWEKVEPTRLWQAIEAGEASASGRRPRSYAKVELTVTNRTKKRIVVDTGGSHLRPKRRGSCQRLGLGPPVVASAAETGGPGEVLLRLEPGATTTLLVNTVCLDANRSAPRTHTFVGVAEPLPEVRENVLRWWVDHPGTPQGAVNSAIWRFSPKVVTTGLTVEHRRADHLRVSAAHGGLYYQLKNGELTSLDAEGVRRVHGSQVELVFPTDEAVYAVMAGEDGDPDLWRLAPTGENPWGFVMDLDPSSELLGVVPAGKGRLVLLTSDDVTLFDAETERDKKLISIKTDRFLSARVTKSGQVDVTVHDPRDNGITRGGAIEGQSAGRFEIWRIDPTRGTHEMRERSWNVSAMRAGPAGIYGLSHKGVLRRYARGKWKDVGPSDAYSSLVAVGRDVVWALTPSDKLVALSPDSGRVRTRCDARVNKDMWFDVDPVTGDLAYTSRDGFCRIRAADGSVEELPDMASPDDEPIEDEPSDEGGEEDAE